MANNNSYVKVRIDGNIISWELLPGVTIVTTLQILTRF